MQFVPIEITSNKKETISGYYAVHIWNKLQAIDKNNYEGDGPDVDFDGRIFSLQRFSLNEGLLNEIPLEKRLIFGLLENDTVTIVHQSVYEKIQNANLTGIRFWKVSEWDDNTMF